MAKIKLKGNPIHTSGDLPSLKSKAPDFTLVDKNLKDRTLEEFAGKKKVITTVPSLDTGVCSLMTKQISDLAKKHPQIAFITISADLPFAQSRFCSSEGISNIITLSMMRNKDFGKAYGVLIVDGPLAGVLARAVLLLDERDHVIYSELVPEITTEPKYDDLAKLL